MANARFLYDDLVRRSPATLLTNSVGSWLTTRPQSFILNPWRKKVARSSTAATNVDIVLDLGAAKSFNCAFLVQPKIHAGGTVKIQANSSNSWGSPAFDSGAFPAINTERRLTGLYFGTQTYRYVRILWVNTGAVSDYVELGYLMLGMYYEPSYNITEQLDVKPVDPSVVSEAYDGEIQAFQKTQYYTISCFLEAMPFADRQAMQTLFATVGKTQPLMLAVDSDVLGDTFYGYLNVDIEISFAPGTVDLWDISIGFSEAR